MDLKDNFEKLNILTVFKVALPIFNPYSAIIPQWTFNYVIEQWRRQVYRNWQIFTKVQEQMMSVDIDTVKRVAKLARIALDDEKASTMQGELNTILGFIDQLNEVDIDGVAPMTSVVDTAMKKRKDIVNDGDRAEDVVANAPEVEDNFFMVTKVIE